MKIILLLSPLMFAQTLPASVQLQAKILGSILAVLWGLELIDSILLRGALDQFGIRPRRLRGLPGIVLAPLLHGDLKHLAANTGPLVVLGWFILWQGVDVFVIVTGVSALISGLGVWLLGGPRTNHLGASGVVFGYFGFLLWRGYFEQSAVAIALAAITGLLYGSLIWGALPVQRGKSWQGHLFGFIGGGVAARFLPLLQAQLEQWVKF
ncbi:MAG: rhomboid family intramembrane serine protease [Cyanobacteria bacterium P01_A01_bin.114]